MPSNPFQQKRETLGEFNARRAKERKPLARMKQLVEVSRPPDFQKILAAAPMITVKCPKCLDIGWILRDQTSGTFSRKCGCGYWTERRIRRLTTSDQEIPI